MTYEKVSEGSMTVHDCKRAAWPNPAIGTDLKWPTPGTMFVDWGLFYHAKYRKLPRWIWTTPPSSHYLPTFHTDVSCFYITAGLGSIRIVWYDRNSHLTQHFRQFGQDLRVFWTWGAQYSAIICPAPWVERSSPWTLTIVIQLYICVQYCSWWKSWELILICRSNNGLQKWWHLLGNIDTES